MQKQVTSLYRRQVNGTLQGCFAAEVPCIIISWLETLQVQTQVKFQVPRET